MENIIDKQKIKKPILFKKVRITSTLHVHYIWKGKKNNFVFELFLNKSIYHVSVSHLKKDIRFHGSWQDISFTNIQDGFDWCDNFDYTNFKCKGKDVTEKK